MEPRDDVLEHKANVCAGGGLKGGKARKRRQAQEVDGARISVEMHY